MKALIIGLENEEFKTIKNFIETTINKSEIFYLNSDHDLIEVLTQSGPFSFIVQNLDDLNYSAIELHQNISDIIGTRPYIYIGSQSAQKSQLNFELINKTNTVYILEPPLNLQSFKTTLAHCQTWIKNEEFEQSIQEFHKDEMRPMRLKNFYLFDVLPYEVFIDLSNNKYGKVISKNKPFSQKLIHAYAKKNVKVLHVKKSDYLKQLDQSIKNLITIFKSRSLEKSKTIKMQLKAIFYIQEYIKALSVTDEVLELTKLVSESISDFSRFDKTMIKLLEEIEDIKLMTFAEISLICAYLNCFVMTKMEWSAESTKEKLIVASIIQDINLKNEGLYLIRSINDPDLKLFTDEEQLQFKEHPRIAQEIAKLFSGYTELDFILKEHHEHPHGDGFPSGIGASSLTTISCVFIVSTHFLSRLSRSPNGLSDLRDVLMSMRKTYQLGNFKDPMTALIKCF